MTATTAPATMDDVAALAGVSTSTVSRALRDSPRISASTRDRVHQAAARLDFALSRTASALASGRLGRIGVLVSSPLSTWFNSSVLEAAYATLRTAGQELVIYRILDAADRADFFAALPARRNVDALVVASFALSSYERERLAELSVPVVYLNQELDQTAGVCIDDTGGAAAATWHLIHLGHRRLAYVTTRDLDGFTFSAARRFTGARRAVDQHNRVRVDDPIHSLARMVVDSSGGVDEVGQLAVGQLLSSERLPTAVICETDDIAMSLISALSRAGLRVPDDLSVLGFDDSAYAPLFDLTTVAQPVAELGHRAAALALELASGETAENLQRVLPTRLVLRGSTAVPG
ncbi:MAG TPA: LacI family DNA-binding transcriptional regulator [Microlunatus sp.]|nr:LacI family DNA-binding transcriptional regulator [Microlunatus sp.]